jgi:hypothetical protein
MRFAHLTLVTCGAQTELRHAPRGVLISGDGQASYDALMRNVMRVCGAANAADVSLQFLDPLDATPLQLCDAHDLETALAMAEEAAPVRARKMQTHQR